MPNLKTLGPFGINVGIDCEDIRRWKSMLVSLESGPRRKLFSEDEHRYCRSFKDSAPHYAARWCAKEAFVKAMSPFSQVDLRTVEVANDDNGSPFIVWNCESAKSRAFSVSLSISHSQDTAVAVAVVMWISAPS